MCKLSRREIASVCVSKSCDEVLEYVERRVLPPKPGQKRPRFSLYLSAQLMYGLTLIHQKQISFLLLDASYTYVRVRMMPDHLIDLPEEPRMDTVTLTQPDFEIDAHLEIETTIDQSLDISRRNSKNQFWGLSSSSNKSSSTSSGGTRRSRSSLNRSSDDVNVIPTVSIEQITLVDPPPIIVNSVLSPIPVPRDEELPPMNGQELNMFLETIPEARLTVEDLLPTSTPVHRGLDAQLGPTEESAILEEPKERTPSKRSSRSGVPTTRTVPPSPGVTQQILTSPLLRKRNRPSIRFELNPLTPSPSRKRQRKQLVFADKETQIPKTEMKQNLITSGNLTRTFELVNPLAEIPDALFKRPSRKGSRPEVTTGIWGRAAVFRPNIPEDEIPPIESSFTSSEGERYAQDREAMELPFNQPEEPSVGREPSLMDIDMIQLDQNLTIPEVQPHISLTVPEEPEFRVPTLTPLVTPTEGRRKRRRKSTLEQSVERLRQTGASLEQHGSRTETPSFEQQRDASTPSLSGSLLDTSRKSRDRSTSKKMPRTSASGIDDLSITDNLSEKPQTSHTESRTRLLYDVKEESLIQNQSPKAETLWDPLDLLDNQETFLKKVIETVSDQETTTFREICPPSSTTRNLAARSFTALLDLAAKRILRVKQKVSFGDIYIRIQE